jgi:hypothetical protein
MRPLGFLVADKNMQACLLGLFSRTQWHRSMGCAPVDVLPDDVHVAAGQSDPGLYTRGNELLRPYAGRYSHMVLMVDAEWEGSPGAAAIAARAHSHLQSAGWTADNGLALILTPEVDVWLWTKTDHTAHALGWDGWKSLDAALATEGLWPQAMAKPPRPKEAAEWALRQRRVPRSSRVYQRVAQAVGIRQCSDPAFGALRTSLQRWFPPADA